VSKQSVRNRDVIKSCRGASAFTELALLGVFCSVIGVTALAPAASARAGSVKVQQDQSLALPQFLSTRKEKKCKNVLTQSLLLCFIQ
jgi:hypothetical protein